MKCISNTICYVCIEGYILEGQPERQRRERETKSIQRDTQTCRERKADGWMGGGTVCR